MRIDLFLNNNITFWYLKYDHGMARFHHSQIEFSGTVAPNFTCHLYKFVQIGFPALTNEKSLSKRCCGK